MIEILNLYRYNSLQSYYKTLKNEAKELLKIGDVTEYLLKLKEVQKVKLQIVRTTNNAK